jgi:uncharacterized integral membrane protein
MRNLLTAIIVIPVAAVLIVLALANRDAVTLSIDPFTPATSIYSIQLPLFLVILLSVAIGLIIGSVADWFQQGRYRREARHGRAELRRLEEEAELRRRETAATSNLPAPYYGDTAR